MQHCEHQCSNGGQLTPKIDAKTFKGCISVYSRECGWVLLVKAQQCRAVEQHM